VVKRPRWQIRGHIRAVRRISEAGINGRRIAFVDCFPELPYFIAKVLPRLKRIGIRLPAEPRVRVTTE